jgi:aldose 1-epimerase
MIKDIISIRSGEWQANICPRLGGNVIKLTWGGKDVLRPLDNEEQLKINPYLQGSPVLMPANRTYRGRFVFEGKEYFLPINEPQNDCNLHGSVLSQPFETVKVTDDRAILRFVDREGKIYPFPFALTITYSLTDKGFSASYEVENIGSGSMPLTFSLHTTFVEPNRFSVPIDACQEKDSHHIPTGKYIVLDPQESGYARSSHSEGLVISGYYRAYDTVARVGDYTYTVSENFDHWILFNGRGESGLLCVEPQSGRVNGLNMNDGHTVLSPCEKIKFTTEISRN